MKYSNNIDNKLKEKILVYKTYIKPYLKEKSKNKFRSLKLSQIDEETVKFLAEELELNRNLVAEAYLYYTLIRKLQEENENIISFYEFLNGLEKDENLTGKILYITEDIKYKIENV